MGNVSDDADVVNPAGRWGKHFTWMHALEERMTLRQLRVWCVIVTHANERGECWPAVGTVAGLTGLTDRQVRQAVADLASMGAVVRVQRGNASSIMRIVRPVDGYAPNQGTPDGLKVCPESGQSGHEVCPESGRGVCPESGHQNRPLNRPLDDPSSSTIKPIDASSKVQDDARARPDAPPVPQDPVPDVPAATVAPQCTLEGLPAPTHAPDMKTQPGAGQALLEVVPAVPDGVERLHGLWQQVVGKPGWGLTPKRERAWKALIKAAGSMTRAEQAVRGLGLSDWHMGRDPKTNGAQYVEPDLITRNIDRFCDLQAAVEVPPPAAVTWDQLNAECMRAYVSAVRAITDHVDARVASGTLDQLTDKQRAAFDPLLRPIGMVTWEGERVHVFQWRNEDGTPDNPRTMLFIRSINRAAALVAQRRMNAARPGSKVVEHIMGGIVDGTKQEALEEYNKAVAVMRERDVEDHRCVVGEIVFEEGPTEANRLTGDSNHASTH